MKSGHKKKYLLLSILLLPSLIYFFFEFTQVNFKKMPYYGPKKIDTVSKDTIYYSVPENGFLDTRATEIVLDTNKYPVFLIGFIDDSLRANAYKLNGLANYDKFDPNKLKAVTILLVSANDKNGEAPSVKQTLKIKSADVEEYRCRAENFDSIRNLYFTGKPVFVFNYFFILVDKKRHIRSYYDPNQDGEVKKMIAEFEHLKLRDEQAKSKKINTIEKK
ncbi:MAG: hypothetical protein IAF38_22755 [Bacteroidia bacterium]|nr:hypothetical protein [Bacteroidia bacterium]